MWIKFMVTLNLLMAADSINRPVYKIVLNQKGFAQFLQYDVETPPLREFTFCTWIRMYDLTWDQSIFTYVVNGNNRVIRLWLSSGGKQIKISINGRVTSNSHVDIVKDVWRHVCLSYQSDYGAWALYIDARLFSCEATQSLYGFILPAGGSVIIGYGTADNGEPNGFEGEIFGANMILTSTIERNYTTKNDPVHEQKPFTRNKVKSQNKNSYIVLKDLQTDEIHNNFEKSLLPTFINKTKNYVKFKTPHSFVEHNVGVNLSSTTPKSDTKSQETLDISVTDKAQTTIYKDEMNIWNIVNQNKQGRFRTSQKTTSKAAQYESRTRDNVSGFTISEYEAPPVPPSTSPKYFKQNFEMEKRPVPLSIYKMKDDSIALKKSFNNKKYINEISEVETPPLLSKDTKAYGQWTSSKFAGNVLNYLKSINFQSRDKKKVQQNIPFIKISDTLPYASDFKINKVRKPSQFQRHHFIENRFAANKKNSRINVQILKDDIRTNRIKSQVQTQPKQVEITNRGESMKNDHRHYRNADNQEYFESINTIDKKITRRPFSVQSIKKNNFLSSEKTLQNNNLMSILPFLKTLEYYIEESANRERQNLEKDNIYIKSLLNANKWHNSKSYSNDYTPRKINMESNGHSELDNKIAEYNKKHPSVRLNYIHETHKVEKSPDADILKGRELATEVSNQSNYNKDSISLLKFNHGFLPGHEKKVKIYDKLNSGLPGNLKARLDSQRGINNKHVKIDNNAVNEKYIIGVDNEQKTQSYVGGFGIVPDKHRYRSNIDHMNGNIPSSLGPRVCKNVELYDRVLYVQPDESIDMTHILSPVRVKNMGIEFIMQNYKKCSLSDSSIENNEMLFIDWSKTPVRLFGGAFPRTTTDLCGFF
ncbi:uncharacterized protein LOC115447262 [Manduca sexta]|uniref:Pentraxin (PTX) domain-containing protein n=1 Tax=Manduca sexta TaxID=7130 RepID=A0A921ZEE9_MANSE|nr:uncharacterized protein LOC115447262 [Manduca sexta]KAG6455995.1 hypothetical protein O3G_MSEX009524 [Manduca sexta]